MFTFYVNFQGCTVSLFTETWPVAARCVLIGVCFDLKMNIILQSRSATSYYSQGHWHRTGSLWFSGIAISLVSIVFSTNKSQQKSKMRFTSLPTKSESSPSQISPPLLPPRSRWDNNFAVPMCGPWWRCHGSSYFLDLKWCVKSWCSWGQMIFPWVREIQPWHHQVHRCDSSSVLRCPSLGRSKRRNTRLATRRQQSTFGWYS